MPIIRDDWIANKELIMKVVLIVNLPRHTAVEALL